MIRLQDACLPSFVLLQNVQTLKLALELAEVPHQYYAEDRSRKVGSVDESIRKWADALALRLPNLQKLAFEVRSHTGRALGPRALVGKPRWVWFYVNTSDRQVRRVRETVDYERAGEIRGLPKNTPSTGSNAAEWIGDPPPEF